MFEISKITLHLSLFITFFVDMHDIIIMLRFCKKEKNVRTVFLYKKCMRRIWTPIHLLLKHLS